MMVHMKTSITTYIALLRGVNVGGHNKLVMAELRAHFESLGLRDVQTFIQSGNVIFTSADDIHSDALEAAISSRFDIVTPVVLRTAPQFATVARHHPFPGVDLARLHVGFLRQTPSAGDVAALELDQFSPDRARVVNGDVYLYLPSGMARNKLSPYVDRRLKSAMTIRNWNTVTKLCALTSG